MHTLNRTHRDIQVHNRETQTMHKEVQSMGITGLWHIQAQNRADMTMCTVTPSIQCPAGYLPGTSNRPQSSLLWPGQTAHCSLHYGRQPPIPSSGPLSTHSMHIRRNTIWQHKTSVHAHRLVPTVGHPCINTSEHLAKGLSKSEP